MLISAAYAAGTVATTGTGTSMQEPFIMNLMLVLTLVVLFYFLMIVPQQKRFRKHREMLSAMKKGDKIVTAGGLLGTIDRITDNDEEVGIDLGNNMKVTALRSTIQLRTEPAAIPAKAAKTATDKKTTTTKSDENV